ncbi:MAG: hypothetical protein IT373_31850 [Polyangiaceae bacterium]|nr:hypothetical protein [Polyangiaceae bacterium]
MRHLSDLTYGYELALVRAAPVDLKPALLWKSPDLPLTMALATGSGGLLGGAGLQLAEGLVPVTEAGKSGIGEFLRATSTTVHLESTGADTGAALLLRADGNLPASETFAGVCAPTPAESPGPMSAADLLAPPDPVVLVGIASVAGVGERDYYVPVFRYYLADWVAAAIADDDPDGDGWPQCVDPCPDDGVVAPFDHWGDADRDGRCNGADSCVLAAPARPAPFGDDNCNGLSESFHALGETKHPDNICDPVLCPSASPETAVGPQCNEPLCGPTIPDDPCPAGNIGLKNDPVLCADPAVSLWTICREQDRGKIRMAPLRSYSYAGFGGAAALAPGESLAVSGVETSARFCQRDEANGIFCDHAAEVRDILLTQAPSAAEELPTNPYHRVTFTAGGPSDPDASMAIDYTYRAGVSLSPVPGVPGVPEAPNPPPLEWVWDWQQDLARWLGAPQLILNRCAGAIGGCSPLVGAFWLHAASAVGETDDIGTGKRDLLELANHYVTDPDPNGDASYAPWSLGCFACGRFEGVLADVAQPPPGPPPSPQHLVWRHASAVSAGAYRRVDATAGEADVLLRLGAVQWAAVAGPLGAGCDGELVTLQLGPRLRARLSSPTPAVWASAIEPRLDIGASPSAPVAVALAALGGDELVDSVVTDDSGLFADGDRPGCGPGSGRCPLCASGLCDASGACCDVPCTSAADCPGGRCEPTAGVCTFALALGSPHAVDFVPIYTRALRGVFVVGGRDLASDANTGEIWFLPLAERGWKRIPTGAYLPETVLAATFSFADGRLYVLDETAEGYARLASIDPVGAGATVLASYPRHPAWNRQFLVPDYDGALLLASSRAPMHGERKYAIARLRTSAAIAGADDCDEHHGGSEHEHRGHRGGDHRGSRHGHQGGGHGHGGAHDGGACPARSELVLDGIERGPRALVLAPVVDASGYTLVLQKNHGNGRIERKRRQALALEPASLSDLGAQL